MIGRNGFGATSIRALASEAGVSHGTVQHHFPTKDSLWKALVDEVIVPNVTANLDQLRTEGGGLNTILEARLIRGIERPGFSAAVLTDRTEGAVDRLRYLAEATHEVRDQAIAHTQTLVDNGLVRPIDPVALAALNLVLAFLASSDLALQALFDIDITVDARRDELVASIVDIVMHGLLPRD